MEYSILWLYHNFFNHPLPTEPPWMSFKYVLIHMCQKFSRTVLPSLLTSQHCQTRLADLACRSCSYSGSTQRPRRCHGNFSVVGQLGQGKELPGLRVWEYWISQCGLPNSSRQFLVRTAKYVHVCHILTNSWYQPEFLRVSWIQILSWS